MMMMMMMLMLMLMMLMMMLLLMMMMMLMMLMTMMMMMMMKTTANFFNFRTRQHHLKSRLLEVYFSPEIQRARRFSQNRDCDEAWTRKTQEENSGLFLVLPQPLLVHTVLLRSRP